MLDSYLDLANSMLDSYLDLANPHLVSDPVAVGDHLGMTQLPVTLVA